MWILKKKLYTYTIGTVCKHDGTFPELVFQGTSVNTLEWSLINRDCVTMHYRVLPFSFIPECTDSTVLTEPDKFTKK